MSDDLVSGFDMIGRGFDALSLDPLNINAGAAIKYIFDIQRDKATKYGSGDFLVPIGTTYTFIGSADVKTEKRSFSCSAEFSNEFRAVASINAGVESVFDFSLSATFNEIEGSTTSAESVSCIVSATRVIHRLDLDLDKSDLSAEFSEEIGHLPTEISMPDDYSPASLHTLDWAKPYIQLIEGFGSIVSERVSMGGSAWQKCSTQINQEGFTSSNELDLKASAEVSVEAFFKAGGSIESADKAASTVDKTNSIQRSELHFRGGNQPSVNDTNDAWLSSVAAAPVVVDGTFFSIASLLTKKFFPYDPMIEEKASVLEFVANERAAAIGKLPRAALRFGDQVEIYAYENSKPYPLVSSTLSGSTFLRLDKTGSGDLTVFTVVPIKNFVAVDGYPLDTDVESPVANAPVISGRGADIYFALVNGTGNVLMIPDRTSDDASYRPRLGSVPPRQIIKYDDGSPVFRAFNRTSDANPLSSKDVPLTILHVDRDLTLVSIRQSSDRANHSPSSYPCSTDADGYLRWGKIEPNASPTRFRFRKVTGLNKP